MLSPSRRFRFYIKQNYALNFCVAQTKLCRVLFAPNAGTHSATPWCILDCSNSLSTKRSLQVRTTSLKNQCSLWVSPWKPFPVKTSLKSVSIVWSTCLPNNIRKISQDENITFKMVHTVNTSEISDNATVLQIRHQKKSVTWGFFFFSCMNMLYSHFQS